MSASPATSTLITAGDNTNNGLGTPVLYKAVPAGTYLDVPGPRGDVSLAPRRRRSSASATDAFNLPTRSTAMANPQRALTADDGLVSIHGRRLTIAGDGITGDTSALLLDGKVIGTARAAIKKVTAGSNGVGAVTLAGSVPGDSVELVANLSTPGDVTSSFESVISVAGQIQQTAVTNLSAAQLLFQVSPRS